MQFTLKDLAQIDRKVVTRRLLPVLWVLGLAAFIVIPIVWTRYKSSAKLSSIQNRIKAAQKNVAELPSLTMQYEKLDQQIKQTRESLFTEDEINRFIANVSEIARKHDVLITGSRPKLLEDYIPTPFDKIYQAYEFQIDMEAEFHGFGQLLAELYRMPQVFKLRKLEITGREQAAQLNQISLSIIVINANTEKAPKGSDKDATKASPTTKKTK